MVTLLNFEITVEDNPVGSTVFKRYLIQKSLEEKHLRQADLDKQDFLQLLVQACAQQTDLLVVSVKEVSLQLTPPFLPNAINRVESFRPVERLAQQVLKFLRDIDKYFSDAVFSTIKTFEGVGCQLFVFGVEVSLRNVPARLLRIKFFSVEGKLVKAAFVANSDPETRALRPRSREPLRSLQVLL